jgi:hypothetical protein
VWLLLVLGMLAVVVVRLSRQLGPAGLILTIVLVVLLIRLARDLLRFRSGAKGPDRQPAVTKNVTPREGWLPPGAAPTAGVTAAPRPSVVVVDAPDATERLETKLEALDRLRASGLVTDDEYEAKRAQLIADF